MIMKDNILTGFKDFIEENKSEKVTTFNYLRFLYMSQEINSEFIILLHKLWYPEFIIVENKVYVKELFEQRNIKISLHSEKSQLWINILEITNLFYELSFDEAIYLTEFLVKSWNSKIHSEFPTVADRAKLLCDKQLDEVYITIEGC